MCSKLALTAVYKLQRMQKIATSEYGLSGNGGLGRFKHALAPICSRWPPTNDRATRTYIYSTWRLLTTSLPAPLPGWSPYEVHVNRHHCTPLSIFQSPYARGYHSLERDRLQLATLQLVVNSVRMMW